MEMKTSERSKMLSKRRLRNLVCDLSVRRARARARAIVRRDNARGEYIDIGPRSHRKRSGGEGRRESRRADGKVENQHFLIRRALTRAISRFRPAAIQPTTISGRDVGARARRYCRVNYDTGRDDTEETLSLPRRTETRRGTRTEPGRAIAASRPLRISTCALRAPEENVRYRARLPRR